jgi:hypothetical protein
MDQRIKGEPMKVKTISGKNGKVVLPDGSTISRDIERRQNVQTRAGTSAGVVIRTAR